LVARCYVCGYQTGVSDDFVGRTTTCPQCAKQLTIGDPELLPMLGSESRPERVAAIAPPKPGLPAALLWCLLIVVLLQLLPGFFGGGVALVTAQSAHPNLPVEMLLETPEFARGMLPWVAVTQATSILIVGLVLARTMGRLWWRQIWLRPPSAFHLLLAVLGLPGVMVLLTGLDGLAKRILPQFIDLETHFRMMTFWPWPLIVLLVGFGPGIGEELWFRGFLGRGLVGRFGAVKGVLLTSLLFGLVHLEPRHVVVAATAGIFLHAVYLGSRSIVVPMVVHVLNNTLSMLALRSSSAAFLDASAEDIPWPVYAAACGLVAAVGWAFYRTRVRPADEPAGETPGLPASVGTVSTGTVPSSTVPSSTVSASLTPADEPAPAAASAGFAGRAPGAVGWLVPLVAAALFVGVTIPAARNLPAKEVVVVYPTEAEVRELLRREPISLQTWPAWSARLREWLPASGHRSAIAYDAAYKFLEPEFDRGEPPVVVRDDAVAWYVRGRGTLRLVNYREKEAHYHSNLLSRARTAESQLRRSIHHDPTIGRAHLALSIALYLQIDPQLPRFKHPPEAQREAAEGEKLDPTASAKSAEAWAALLQRRFADAASQFQKISGERPRDLEMRGAAAEAWELKVMYQYEPER
jgi:uncharacterized protein